MSDVELACAQSAAKRWRTEAQTAKRSFWMLLGVAMAEFCGVYMLWARQC